tara:strand:- start:86 stop:409 length:324 start_codon:yes stop_codon:yes gene_type:complete
VEKKKATQSEKEYRTYRIAALLSRGVTRSEIIKYTAAEWGLKLRQTEQYIQDARIILKKDFDIDRRQFTADILSQLSTLQKEARNNNQLHVALGCINAMAKIAQIST